MKEKLPSRMVPLLLILVSVTLACGRSPTSPGQSQDWETFTESDFSVDMPGWDETQSSDQQVIYNLSDGAATIWIKPWPLTPRLVAENVRTWAESNTQADLLNEQVEAEQAWLELTIDDGLNVMRLRTHLLYCNAQTYEITGGTLEQSFDAYAATFDQSLESARCDPQGRYPTLTGGALGMVILPPAGPTGEFDLGIYQQSLALARDSGVQVSHYYLQWGDVEKSPGIYDWTTPDYIFEAHYLEGFQVSLVVNVIHTTVIGRVPPDLAGASFDDPRFTARLTDFLTALADRYAGRIQYLSIGNEVNDYFATHRDEIPAYATAFDQTRVAIHTTHPDLPVGIVFAYHDAETQGTTDIIQTLNRGDFIAYTLYLYDQGFHFTRAPALIGEYLDRMIALAGDTPVAIVETGWSTAEVLGGSEADQTEYVRQVFTALDARRNQVIFLSWFDMHDSLPEACQELALTFFEPGTQPDPASLEAFVTFICYFGLRDSDGSAKPAWDAWVQEAQEYYTP